MSNSSTFPNQSLHFPPQLPSSFPLPSLQDQTFPPAPPQQQLYLQHPPHFTQQFSTQSQQSTPFNPETYALKKTSNQLKQLGSTLSSMQSQLERFDNSKTANLQEYAVNYLKQLNDFENLLRQFQPPPQMENTMQTDFLTTHINPQVSLKEAAQELECELLFQAQLARGKQQSLATAQQEMQRILHSEEGLFINENQVSPSLFIQQKEIDATGDVNMEIMGGGGPNNVGDQGAPMIGMIHESVFGAGPSFGGMNEQQLGFGMMDGMPGMMSMMGEQQANAGQQQFGGNMNGPMMMGMPGMMPNASGMEDPMALMMMEGAQQQQDKSNEGQRVNVQNQEQ